MASFSFPPARNGSNRPQPHRNNSSFSHKSASPYQRPHSANSLANSNGPPPSNGKWQNDLFETTSDLYNPTINVSHVASIIPGAKPVASASLRPFGDATPAPQRLISTASNPVPSSSALPANQSAPPANDLISRVGIKGSSNRQAQSEQEDKERLRVLRAEKVKLERERREQLRLRKELEQDREEKFKIAEFEETGFVVQVEGLVYGTSAEDVQTAFASYGEIKHCFIVNEKSAREGDILIARITFSRHDDAKTACHKLDGAIADGRPLKVQNVPRSPFPPALPPLPPILASSSSAPASPSLPSGPRGGNAGRGRGRARMGPATIAPPVVPAPAPSKMRADMIDEVYNSQPPVAAVTMASESMDVDMSDVPSGPRRGRGGPTRNGFAGRVVPPQAAQVQAPVSLLQRVNGGAGGGGGSKAAGSIPSGPKSLAERLGQATSASGKGKGAANTSGGSLLDRLK
ncbi:RNA recognition motif domain-containing protein [Sporobolomyces salmoneus]|uniref:RNA recognition motif domain-containing protein n=1 Tax=Sporobolomyces salmoneus TaxID=183962 RepID=UPI003180DA0E